MSGRGNRSLPDVATSPELGNRNISFYDKYQLSREQHDRQVRVETARAKLQTVVDAGAKAQASISSGSEILPTVAAMSNPIAAAVSVLPIATIVKQELSKRGVDALRDPGVLLALGTMASPARKSTLATWYRGRQATAAAKKLEAASAKATAAKESYMSAKRKWDTTGRSTLDPAVVAAFRSEVVSRADALRKRLAALSDARTIKTAADVKFARAVAKAPLAVSKAVKELLGETSSPGPVKSIAKSVGEHIARHPVKYGLTAGGAISVGVGTAVRNSNVRRQMAPDNAYAKETYKILDDAWAQATNSQAVANLVSDSAAATNQFNRLVKAFEYKWSTAKTEEERASALAGAESGMTSLMPWAPDIAKARGGNIEDATTALVDAVKQERARRIAIGMDVPDTPANDKPQLTPRLAFKALYEMNPMEQ